MLLLLLNCIVTTILLLYSKENVPLTKGEGFVNRTTQLTNRRTPTHYATPIDNDCQSV